MNRLYVIRDAGGERRVGDDALPFEIGGAGADVVVPALAAGEITAYVALSDGHAYVQPASGQGAGVDLFLNHERVTGSAWLKSGDTLEVGDTVVAWTVSGDQVFIDVRARPDALVPPPHPPPSRVTADEGDAEANEPALPLVGSAAASSVSRGKRRRPTIAGLSILGLVALYFAVSTPIVVDVTPDPEDYTVEGFPPPLPLWGQYLALPGSYTLRATHEGYYPLERTIKVSFGERAEATYDLEELPGRVSLALRPETEHRELRLLVDGEEAVRGRDGAWELERGRRRLRLETGRYLPEETVVEVEGFGNPQTVDLVLHPAWADVRFESDPAGADVAVDGVAIGRTPLDAEILRGEPTVVVSMEGRKPVTLLPEIEAGARLSFIDIVLEPLDGRLLITSKPESATVTIDGVFAGVTPATVVVAPDVEHEIRLSEPGYLGAKRPVSVQPDEDLEVVIELMPEYGTVFLSSQPADAELLVDGRASGSATRRLRLTTRAHELVVRKEGYEPQRLRVTPQAGVSQKLDVTLMTVQAAARAKEPPMITTADGQVLRRIRPTGEFMMGASRREPGRRANESPRRVELTRAFYIGEIEVTNEQFRKFKPTHDSGVADDAALDGDKLPVVGVSWDAAARFCNWLSAKDGLPPFYAEAAGHLAPIEPPSLGYRLPTEAEWAYVTRVHGRQAPARYPWEGGYPPGAATGNFADASIADTLADTVPAYNDGYRGSSPVGSFAAGPSGLRDLGGNVAEWMNDYYAIYPGEDQTLVRDPSGPGSGEHHVVRGSSWRHGAITELRASYRDYSNKGRSDLGFRIARTAE